VSRRLLGALWPLPALLALLSAGGAVPTVTLLGFALGTVALSAVPHTWWRLAARLAWLALFLGLRLGLGTHPLTVSALGLLHHLADGNWGRLSSAQASILFEVAATTLVAIEEVTVGLGLRLIELLVNVAALALAKEVSGHVTWALFATFALWLAVRRADLSGWGKDRHWTWVGALSSVLILITLLVAPAPEAVGALQGGNGPRALTTVEPVTALTQAPELSHQILFTARGALPLYWTLYVSTYYTGQGWTNSLPPPTTYPAALPPQELVLAKQSTAKSVSGQLSATETVHLLTNLPYAPVQGVPEGLSTSHSALWFPQQQAFSVGGTTYTVTASVPKFSAQALASSKLTLNPAAWASSPYLQLPSELPQPVIRLAHQIVKGVGPNIYLRVMAIIHYLQSHEHYTLNYPPDGGQDFVYHFLFVSHQGDCNAFSSSLAVLARAVGIPTRLVVGFTGGQQVAGLDVVRGTDAHSWVQVYMPGFPQVTSWTALGFVSANSGLPFANPYATLSGQSSSASGWLPIDPTPGFGVGLPSPGQSLPAYVAAGQAAAAKTTTTKKTRVVQIHQTLNALSGQHARSQAHPLPLAAMGAGLVALAAAAWLAVGRIRRLRAVAWMARRPWRWQQTARQWLGKDAPELARWLEVRLYAPAQVPSGGFALARADLVRLLGARQPLLAWLAYLA
jgi:hypothetical protein